MDPERTLMIRQVSEWKKLWRPAQDLRNRINAPKGDPKDHINAMLAKIPHRNAPLTLSNNPTPEQETRIRSLVVNSRLSPDNKAYILAYLRDPTAFPAPTQEDKKASQDAAKKMGTAGNTFLEEHNLKPMDPMTWEKFTQNPLTVIPHFLKNIGPAGALGLMAFMFTRMIGAKSKFITYPMGILAGAIFMQGIGLWRPTLDALSGKVDTESWVYKFFGSIGLSISDGFSWL